jgi:hypothetical protein
MRAHRPVEPQREQSPSQASSQQTLSTQKPEAQVAERLQPPPFAMSGSQTSVLAEQNSPSGQLPAVHAPSQIVPAQRPVGQSRIAGTSQIPALLHAPGGK